MRILIVPGHARRGRRCQCGAGLPSFFWPDYGPRVSEREFRAWHRAHKLNVCAGAPGGMSPSVLTEGDRA